MREREQTSETGKQRDQKRDALHGTPEVLALPIPSGHRTPGSESSHGREKMLQDRSPAYRMRKALGQNNENQDKPRKQGKDRARLILVLGIEVKQQIQGDERDDK